MNQGTTGGGSGKEGGGGPGFRVHPLDLLVLLLAVFLGVAAYTFLFHRQPVPRPVDPLLGKVLLLEFPADREWKRSFPEAGKEVLLDDMLLCDVEEVAPAAPSPDSPSPDSAHPRVRLRVRVRERSAQRPDTMTLFRTGIRRGTRLRVSDREDEVEAEVLEVEEPKGGR
jgi:hypothetical protein